MRSLAPPRAPAAVQGPARRLPQPPAAVPGAPASAGRMTYRPASYNELVSDAVRSLLAARAAGLLLLEVEFPPLPASMDAYKGSSDEFIDQNLSLALAAAKQLAATGLRCQIVVPDGPELVRAEARFAKPLSLLDADSVSFGALTGTRLNGLQQIGKRLFGTGGDERPTARRDADVYLVVNASTSELVSFEAFVTEVVPASAMVVAFNLELETARGDLGLPGFPGKDLHHRFLCRFTAALFLRQRSYSKTVAAAPFLLNYEGATFREYPGPWQVMLRDDSGVLACIAERPGRYGLGEAKEELLAAMGLNTEEAGSSMEFLRRGYKTATWWEESSEEESSAWRA